MGIKYLDRMIVGMAIVSLAICAAAQGKSESLDPSPQFEETPPPVIDLPYHNQPVPNPDTPPSAPLIDLKKVGAAMEPTQPSSAESSPSSPAVEISTPKEVSYLKAVSALLFVLGLILVSSYFIRRYGPRTPLLKGASLAKLHGRVYLNPRTTLHFIEIGKRVLVIGVTPNHISLVAEFDTSVLEESQERETLQEEGNDQKGAFARLMEKLRKKTSPSESEESGEKSEADDSLKALREEIIKLQQYVKEMSRSETKF